MEIKNISLFIIVLPFISGFLNIAQNGVRTIEVELFPKERCENLQDFSGRFYFINGDIGIFDSIADKGTCEETKFNGVPELRRHFGQLFFVPIGKVDNLLISLSKSPLNISPLLIKGIKDEIAGKFITFITSRNDIIFVIPNVFSFSKFSAYNEIRKGNDMVLTLGSNTTIDTPFIINVHSYIIDEIAKKSTPMNSRLFETLKPPTEAYSVQETIVIEPDRRFLTNDSPVEDIIRYWSDYYDYPFQKAYYLAKCESQFEPSAENGISSATGLYQFIDSTWKTECEGDRLSSIHNARCAIRLLSEGKESHWLADPGVPKCLLALGITL